MQIKTKEIERGLLGKDFRKDNTDHKIFRLIVNGQVTRIRTKTSHGSKYKDYGNTLIDAIKKDLHLDTKQQLQRLIDCSLTIQDYIACLRAKGFAL